jgi:ATP-binding cassette subfamily F protein 3
VEVTDLWAAYEDTVALREVTFALSPGRVYGLVGPNGAGKSTLLKVIFGDLEPTSGEVRRSGKVRIGKFSQHHVDQLDLSLSALEAFQRAYPQATPADIRKHLGGMGLGGNLALQPMRTLSGGQKSRAAFAQIMWQRPHLLLLVSTARALRRHQLGDEGVDVQTRA